MFLMQQLDLNWLRLSIRSDRPKNSCLKYAGVQNIKNQLMIRQRHTLQLKQTFYQTKILQVF